MALDTAKARYLDGLSDYLPVLSALTSVQGLERAELTARREILSRRIAIHRSVGGSPL
jgi:outer membrane protein TolC